MTEHCRGISRSGLIANEDAPVPASIPSANILPNDRSIMRNSRWGGSFKPDLKRCRVAVSYKVGRGYDRKQCAKPVTITRLVDGPEGPEEIGYCGTHDPVRVKQREEQRVRHAQIEAQARAKHYALEAHVRRSWPAYEKALRLIANGTGNAQQIAAHVLATYDALLASAIDARSGETREAGLDPKDESEVPQADAQEVGHD